MVLVDSNDCLFYKETCRYYRPGIVFVLIVAVFLNNHLGMVFQKQTTC